SGAGFIGSGFSVYLPNRLTGSIRYGPIHVRVASSNSRPSSASWRRTRVWACTLVKIGQFGACLLCREISTPTAPSRGNGLRSHRLIGHAWIDPFGKSIPSSHAGAGRPSPGARLLTQDRPRGGRIGRWMHVPFVG